MARLRIQKEMAMTTQTIDATRTGEPREIATTLLQLGATSYGGPAIMGLMQHELQERREWVCEERLLEGLAVANMVPGATATQLGIFLAYARGGWWNALLGGLCFVLPAFVIMLALTIAYANFGVTPLARGALYGLGPVVIGLFAIALYRLGKTAASTVPEGIIGIAAAGAVGDVPTGNCCDPGPRRLHRSVRVPSRSLRCPYARGCGAPLRRHAFHRPVDVGVPFRRDRCRLDAEPEEPRSPWPVLP